MLISLTRNGEQEIKVIKAVHSNLSLEKNMKDFAKWLGTMIGNLVVFLKSSKAAYYNENEVSAVTASNPKNAPEPSHSSEELPPPESPAQVVEEEQPVEKEETSPLEDLTAEAVSEKITEHEEPEDIQAEGQEDVSSDDTEEDDQGDEVTSKAKSKKKKSRRR